MAKNNETPEERKKRLAKNKRIREAKKRNERKVERERLRAEKEASKVEPKITPPQEKTTSSEPSPKPEDFPKKEVTTETNYSPLNSPVKKREYTIPKINPSELEGELEVPIFTAPSMEDFDEISPEEKSKTPEPKKEAEPLNPHFNSIPKKEQEMGAELLADVAIDSYSNLKQFIGKLAKISEDKLAREIADGNINPDLEIQIDQEGNSVTVQEFVKEFNEETNVAFETTDDFKEKVKPLLHRIFQKRGFAVTDEQVLLYYGVSDVITTVSTGIALKKTANGILENLRIQTQTMNKGSVPHPENAQKQTTHEASPVTAQEFNEPEESKAKEEEAIEITEAIVIHDPSNDKLNSEAENSGKKMPEFGDHELLEDMQKLAEREQQKENSKKSTQRNKNN